MSGLLNFHNHLCLVCCRCDQLGEELETERLEAEIWRSDHQQRRLHEAGQAERRAGGGLGKYLIFTAGSCRVEVQYVHSDRETSVWDKIISSHGGNETRLMLEWIDFDDKILSVVIFPFTGGATSEKLEPDKLQ